MNVDDLVMKFGSESEAARKLGLTRAAISVWRKRGIPVQRQALIQLMTRGRLRAELAAATDKTDQPE
jgi:hypothetical protein